MPKFLEGYFSKTDLYLGNCLLSFYAKCGAFAKAEVVFDELITHDVVSWNALITGYVQHGFYEQALNCLEVLKIEGQFPNGVTFVCLLKACSSLRAVGTGMVLHTDIMKDSLLDDVFVNTALIDMYSKCGAIPEAQRVFDFLTFRNIISWTALITGYVEQNCIHNALKCFERMQCEGQSPNAATFVCVLKACGFVGAINKGKEMHEMVARQLLFPDDIMIGTALVDMYSKCGVNAYAQRVFDKLQIRNVICWNTLITGYVQNGKNNLALQCFEQMKCDGISPNEFTFVCILKACGSISASRKGKSIHAEIVGANLLGKDILLESTLVDMYARCGELLTARETFDALHDRSIVSWSSLFGGYAQYGSAVEILNVYSRIHCEGLYLDAVSLLSILKACSSIGETHKGKQIHSGIFRGLVETDSSLGNTLVDMYVKCAMMKIAQEAFDYLEVRNVVSWTILMGGYAQYGQDAEALDSFEQMKQEGVAPNEVTFISVLNSCGSIGAIEKGMKIHTYIALENLLKNDILVGNALVDMYGKCGEPTKAEEVFNQLPPLDVTSWNALIAAYALVGDVVAVVRFFSKMIEIVQPDIVTFTISLIACSHSGFLNEGCILFQCMISCYAIFPTFEHYTCMVDLFGRAGHVETAAALIIEAPTSDHLPMWISLLGACQKWRNMTLGNLAFEHAIELDEEHPAAYVYMGNLFITAPL